MALGVNVRGGFEGGLVGLKMRETGGVEGSSARAGMEEVDLSLSQEWVVTKMGYDHEVDLSFCSLLDYLVALSMT